MTKILPLMAALLGFAGVFVAMRLEAVAQGEPKYRLVAPFVTSDGVRVPNPPTPTPEPAPYMGNVAAITLPSANLAGNSPIERRHTIQEGDRERLQDPSHPSLIAWYDRFGQPGSRATNSMFAAHVNYVNYGDGPFYKLTSTQIGDTLTIIMDNGAEYYYTVQSVEVIELANLDMNAIVYPPLDSFRERVTLISCGGTFVPYPGGGGEYASRVILVAERFIP